MTFDPEAVRAFEHAGWQRAAAEYNATFAHASARFVDALLDAAGVGAATRLLDVCCGTGVVTVAAAGRGADATGVDFSAAMLDQARRVHAQTSLRRGRRRGAALSPTARSRRSCRISAYITSPIPTGRWPKRVGYCGQAGGWRSPTGRRRPKMSPGGCCSMRSAPTAICRPQTRHRPAAICRRRKRRCGCSRKPALPSAGRRLSAESGWWTRPRDLITALARGTVRTAALIHAQSAEARPKIEAAIAAAAAAYRRGEGYAVPIAAILASGTRPAA